MTTRATAKLRSVVADVGAALRRPAPPSDGDAAVDVALSGGYAGYAIFYAYASRVATRPGDARRFEAAARRCLERALRRIADNADRPFFSYGLAGLGWTLEHLRGWIVPADQAEEVNSTIDDVIAQYLAHAPPTWPSNLHHGWAGFGAYALERLPHSRARVLLEGIVERLATAAEHTRAGMRWRTVPAWIPLPPASDGACYLGVTTGAAGIVAVLAAARARGIASREAGRLAEGGLAWIWAQRFDRLARTRFPSFAGASHGERWSWTDGDLGIAGTIAAATKSSTDGAFRLWRERALRLLREMARERDVGLYDHSIESGAAGVAHAFARLARDTGEEVFTDAARRWLRRLVAAHRSGQGTAGYRFFVSAIERQVVDVPGKRFGWRGLPGFWNGAAGIGLAAVTALDASDDDAWAWDRSLLFSSW